MNWTRIAGAVEFYQSAGFTYVDVPWLVNADVGQVTTHFDNLLSAQYPGKSPKYVIGSGEQGFIQMLMDGSLNSRKAVTVTPCFRNDKVDTLHKPYFMKVELIQVLLPNQDQDLHLKEMAKTACAFFRAQSSTDIQIVKVGPNEQDIVSNGIEIGSYGCRQYKDQRWIYGTGLAEPRFSFVVS